MGSENFIFADYVGYLGPLKFHVNLRIGFSISAQRLLEFSYGFHWIYRLVWVVLVLVAQSCPTLCNCMDCSPSGSSVHGIFQTRILEWVAISISRESSWPRDQTHVSFVSCIAGRFFTYWAIRESKNRPFIYVFFNFFQQFFFFWFSMYMFFTYLVKFISRYFILLDDIINEIVFLISLSDCSLWLYKTKIDFCVLIL